MRLINFRASPDLWGRGLGIILMTLCLIELDHVGLLGCAGVDWAG